MGLAQRRIPGSQPSQKKFLLNTKEDHITKVKHLRSFLKLYKTLHMATPAISRVLSPLEDAVAVKLPSYPIHWDHALSQRFREAKSHINTAHTIYLPHPDDQLVIKTDPAAHSPGIGHTVYAIKGKELVPVRFHSSKLKPACRLWSLCEIESLEVAVAIESEYSLL